MAANYYAALSCLVHSCYALSQRQGELFLSVYEVLSIWCWTEGFPQDHKVSPSGYDRQGSVWG
jgi:hypothetical protein